MNHTDMASSHTWNLVGSPQGSEGKGGKKEKFPICPEISAKVSWASFCVYEISTNEFKPDFYFVLIPP